MRHVSVSSPPGGSRDPVREFEVQERAVTAAALDTLAIPELAFPLVALGLMGLAWWLAAPSPSWAGAAGTGLLVPGVAGLIALPASAAAALLLVLGAASLWMEIVTTPGHGLHAVGGAVGLMAGGLVLEGGRAGAHPGVVVPTAVLVGAAAFVVGRRSRRCTRGDPFARGADLTGQEAVVLSSSGHRGFAVVCGEMWPIRSSGRRLRAGEVVRVTEEGLTWLTAEPGRDPAD